MTKLDNARGQAAQKRSFVPADASAGDWQVLEPLFGDLQQRDISTLALLNDWLADWSELSAALADEASVRYIRMTCHTDDNELEAAYLHYIQEIAPRCEPAFFELSKKFLASPALDELPRERYDVFIRNRKSEVELFRQENVPLQTQDETLSQQYQKLCGEQMVEFDGRQQTIPQLIKILEETDRDRRRAAWTAAVGRQKQDREKCETIFDEMLALRQQMAVNAGFENFLDFQFKRLGRYDYAPEDCERFHDAIEKVIVPLRQKLREKRMALMGVERLAPWDLEVDPEGKDPLKPFASADELIEKVAQVFADVHPAFAEDFNILRQNDLMDLNSRKGKAPGGYQSTLDEARLPFIFMNAAGRNQDVFTLVHEGGHAFHALAYRDEPLHAYRNAPIEFCEVASMGMEMMACENLSGVYSSEDASRARRLHLQDVIVLLPWVARVDAFQHWLYRNPGHTRSERAAKWLELEKRFGDTLDWQEHSDWREGSWVSKLHFFCVPLYYVEYGIAQLGALQLWANFRANRDEAVRAYRDALALGNSKPLPHLFQTAGIQFQFDASLLQPLADSVEKEILTLE